MAKKPTQFGDVLRAIRLDKGLTQEQLSKKTGIATKQISNFETNSRKPAFENLHKLRKALRCTWDELLG